MIQRLIEKIKVTIFAKVFKKINYLTVKHLSQIFHLKINQDQNLEIPLILFKKIRKLYLIHKKLIKSL